MNFALKSTDIFETSSRSGKYSLRIVDAKFAMPKARGEEEGSVGHEFVCLDMPEYPGEHDNITILFDTESGMLPPVIVSGPYTYTPQSVTNSYKHCRRPRK